MHSSWLTPGRLLLLFCAMNMLVYIDRGNTVPCKIAGKAAHGHKKRCKHQMFPFWQASSQAMVSTETKLACREGQLMALWYDIAGCLELLNLPNCIWVVMAT